MGFFTSAVTTLRTVVTAIGAGVAVWGIINLLEGYGNDNFVEYRIGSRLTFPRFIAPFLPKSFRRRINATSELAANYDLQDRPEFHRRVFSVAWRYKWYDQKHNDRYTPRPKPE